MQRAKPKPKSHHCEIECIVFNQNKLNSLKPNRFPVLFCGFAHGASKSKSSSRRRESTRFSGSLVKSRVLCVVLLFHLQKVCGIGRIFYISSESIKVKSGKLARIIFPTWSMLGQTNYDTIFVVSILSFINRIRHNCSTHCCTCVYVVFPCMFMLYV